MADMVYRYPKFEEPRELSTPEGEKVWHFNGNIWHISFTGLVWSEGAEKESDWYFMSGFLSGKKYKVRGRRELA